MINVDYQNIPDGVVAVDTFSLSAGLMPSLVDTSACVCVAVADASPTAALPDGCFCVIDASVLLNSFAAVLLAVSAYFIYNHHFHMLNFCIFNY